MGYITVWTAFKCLLPASVLFYMVLISCKDSTRSLKCMKCKCTEEVRSTPVPLNTRSTEVKWREDLESILEGADDNDPRLLNYIKYRFLDAPSRQPYNLKRPERVHFSQFNQSQLVDELFQGKRNGFFVECGAAHGEAFSNTLFLERNRNWTGLLIEANPRIYKNLLRKNRKSYSTKACLSVKPHSERVGFKPSSYWGGISDQFNTPHKRMMIQTGRIKNPDITVQCFTLYSLMLALERNTIDYFSLDIEGPELDVLQTIPFDKLKINVISIEYLITDHYKVDEEKTLEKLEAIRKFFKTLGDYKEVAIMPWDTRFHSLSKREANAVDVIFSRHEFVE